MRSKESLRGEGVRLGLSGGVEYCEGSKSSAEVERGCVDGVCERVVVSGVSDDKSVLLRDPSEDEGIGTSSGLKSGEPSGDGLVY